MNTWLKESWKIVLIVLNIPVLIMVSIMFWFYTDAYLIWNPENFNNIASPIGGILAAILLCVAIYQTNLSIKISRAIALKGNFDIEYEGLKAKFNEEIYIFRIDRRLENAMNEFNGIPQFSNEYKFSELTLYPAFEELYGELIQIKDYTDDLSSFSDSPLQNGNYYSTRNKKYIAAVSFLNPFALHGSKKMDLLQNFIIRINSSKLLEEDLEHFRLRIIDDLLIGYFRFLDFYRKAHNQFMIPLLYLPKQDGCIEWEPFAFSEIGRHYDFFNDQLRANKEDV